jgi:hypothetical protein
VPDLENSKLKVLEYLSEGKMKKRSIFVAIVIIMIVVSCSKKAAISEQKQLVLTKLYTVEGYPEGADSTRAFSLDRTRVDEKGNIFILDEKSGSIKVFDSSGSFLNTISKRGLGPEEIENMTSFYMHKDTLFVIDNRIKIKKFRMNGDLISQSVIESDIISYPFKVCVLNDTLLLVNINTFKRTEKSVEISKEMALFNKSFRNKKILYSYITDINELHKSVFEEPVFTFDDKNIYLSTRSKSEYKIKAFSYQGDLVKTVNQNYIKTKFPKEELDYLKQKYKDDPNFDFYYDYKIAVNDLFTDKYGNIWVQRIAGMTGESMQLSFDILSSDKILTNLKIDREGDPEEQNEMEFHISEHFYIVDHSNNLIEVYDYKIE